MTRVIICGGRDFSDQAVVFGTLERVHASRVITEVIHGDASGADKISGDWAAMHGIKVTACAADWSKHGRAAGPIRNGFMLTLKPDGVIAFPGGRGTADMCAQAEKAGIPVMRISTQ